MTDCARCGDCCEDIGLAAKFVEVVDAARETGSYPDGSPIHDNGNISFILEHWRETSRIEVVEPTAIAARYSCDAFDAQTRECTAHDTRPEVCRRFPWYGGAPTADAGLSLRCSFWADVPEDQRPDNVRPLLPMVAR